MVAKKANNRRRIRDPVHDLIDFDLKNELDGVLWQLIQTEPFQRLRRIKQLGFSDFVFPGATHTRFAHSLGVVHIAKQLMKVIKINWSLEDTYQKSMANEAICAALLHDIGHGPFSHAFEQVCRGKTLKDAGAPQSHEAITEKLIMERGDLAGALSNYSTEKVVTHIKNPTTIYGAVVSSQFDADRLDYMQRDRYMTGTQHAGIDFSWLIKNLEISEVPTGADNSDKQGRKATLVLNSKARYAAETYILALFQLYPTVYFHKTTRGAEVLFQAMLESLVEMLHNGNSKETGLPDAHPLVKFIKEPGDLSHYLALDDALVWGSLYMLKEGCKNEFVKNAAERLVTRKLYKAIDVRDEFRRAALEKWPREPEDEDERKVAEERADAVERALRQLEKNITERKNNEIFIDKGERSPYKNNEPIYIRPYTDPDTKPEDIGKFSSVVRNIPTFKFFRVYVPDKQEGEGEWVGRAIECAKKNIS